MNRHATLFVLLMTVATATHARKHPKDAQPTAPTAPAISLTPLPAELVLDGTFRVNISRHAASPEQERALAAAEAASPVRKPATSPRKEEFGDCALTDTQSWSCEDFDGVRIARAITAEAVRYYVNLSLAFRRGKFDGSRGIKMSSSSLTYSAAVSWADAITMEGHEFHGVHVVTLSLSWSDHCGSLCAMHFKQVRQVVVGAQGEVLGVFGDGPPSVTVS